MSSLDQVRMRRAYEVFGVLHGKLPARQTKDSRAKQWLSVAKGFGPEIQRSGLLQALAFVHRGPSRIIAEDLDKHLRQHLTETHHLPRAPADHSNFLVEVRDLPREDYMRVTRELLALSVWLKRVAQIMDDEDDAPAKPDQAGDPDA